MKIYQILNEVKVMSSWISDVRYNRKARLLTMILNNGRAYLIDGISRHMFDRWKSAPSKGRFWHSHIKNKYNVRRI